jgi:hypothetical protein
MLRTSLLMQGINVLGDNRLQTARAMCAAFGFALKSWLASGWNQLKKRPGDVRKELNDATSIGSSRDHKPVPSERKSGMPDGVERPAPVSTTARFAFRNNSAASSIAVMMASEGLAGLLIWAGPPVRR